MFREAVYNLWYLDLKARRRFQLYTILIAFGYGVVNSIAFGRPESRVTWETLSLICALTVGFTLLYAFRAETWPGRLREFFQNRGFFEVGLVSAITMLGLSFARYIPITKVQAFSLDLRLRQAISQPFLGVDSYQNIDSVVSTASVKKVPLKPGLVNAAGGRLLMGSRSDPTAWPTALTVLSYQSSLNSTAPAVSSSTLSGCRFLEVQESAGITVDVSDSIIKGCSQKLDHAAWKNVDFVNATIVYDGGPTSLENVRFENCQFKLSYSANSIELAHSLLGSKSVKLELPRR